MSPSEAARATAWTRVRTESFRYSFATWVSTVRAEMPRRRPICCIVRPSARSSQDLALPRREGRADLGPLPGLPGEPAELEDGGLLQRRLDRSLPGEHEPDRVADAAQSLGFGEVSVHAQAHRLQDGRAVGPFGERDDGAVVAPVAQRPQDLGPGHVGQVEVQDHEVGGHRDHGTQRVLAALLFGHDRDLGDVLAREPDHAEDHRMAPHDQDADRVGCHVGQG